MNYRQGAADYISKKGWHSRVRGKEIEIEHCVFCNDSKYHLHVNAETGVYRCLKCEASGNLWALMKSQGDLDDLVKIPAQPKNVKLPSVDMIALQKNLKQSKAAKDFLAARGLLIDDVIQSFRLGYDPKRKAIAFPYIKDGKVINVKYRIFFPKKDYAKEPGCASSLFNIDHIDRKQPILYIAS